MESKSTDLFVNKNLLRKKYDIYSNNNNFHIVISKSINLYTILSF